MSHIVNDCSMNKFEGGLAALRTVSDSAESGCAGSTAYYKEKNLDHFYAEAGRRGG